LRKLARAESRCPAAKSLAAHGASLYQRPTWIMMGSPTACSSLRLRSIAMATSMTAAR
jgi:hypothetical protein